MAVCAGAVVLHEGRVLFIRQAPGHSLAGRWSIPWGLVDEGETPEDAALRETLEESGVSAALQDQKKFAPRRREGRKEEKKKKDFIVKNSTLFCFCLSLRPLRLRGANSDSSATGVPPLCPPT
jgi:8-oxo-dGTP pyrophosphatase MutT (NUDIX family)